MNRRRLRHDVSHLVSWCLLLFALVTIATGIIADAWDLNGFRLHRLAGYAMAIAALVHVTLSWRRLIAYSRFRLRRLSRSARATVEPEPAPAPVTRTSAPPPRPRRAVTRRGLLGAAAAGTAGLVVGRGLRPTPPIPGGSDLGVVYHEWSKPGVLDALGTLVSWGGKPPQYKSYPDAPRVDLPQAPLADGMPFGDVLAQRRSHRAYEDRSLSLDELAQLLRWTGGLRDGRYRTSPSAGALYPLEIYPIVNRVDGVASGVYHYDIRGHGLELLRTGEFRSQISGLGWDQDFLGASNVVLVITLIYQRLRFKYRDRTYRYGLLEAGHIGQNTYLAATAMGLGACAVGAFRDDGVDQLLGIDGRDEVSLYLLSVGHVAGGARQA